MDGFRDSGVERVVLPASVRVVSQAAFASCGSLSAVVLNEGLEVLGTDDYSKNGSAFYGVFQGSAVEEVHFPSTLKRIEYNAFRNCRNL